MRNERLELCCSGVAFTFEGPEALLERLAQALSEPRSPGARGHAQEGIFTRLFCVIEELGEPAPRAQFAPRAVSIQREASSLCGRAAGASARVYDEPGHTAEARILPTLSAARELLQLLPLMLLQLRGGAMLHAAAVELPEGVMAFIGPSGAGKSTACEHVQNTRLFAADRLAVVPDERGWSAHPLAGGTALEHPLPLSCAQGRPLLGIVRIWQAPRGHWLRDCSPLRALSLLRQSAFQLVAGVAAEAELLAKLESLGKTIKVGELHFALGSALRHNLEDWLRTGRTHAASPAGSARFTDLAPS